MLKIKKAYELRFSPSGQYAAAIGRDVVLWDVGLGKRVGSIHPFSHPGSIDFSADGTRLAVKNTSGEIRIIGIPDPYLSAPLASKPQGQGCELLFSHCGGYLIDGSWEGDVNVRESSTGDIVFRQSHRNAMIKGFCASANRSLFAYVIQPKAISDAPPPPSRIVLRKWPFSEAGSTTLETELAWVWRLALDPTGSRLALVQQLGPREFRLELRKLDDFELISWCYIPLSGTGWSVAWSPDGKHVGCVENSKINFYETDALSKVKSIAIPYPSFVEFSADGSMVALGSWENGRIMSVESVLSYLLARPNLSPTQ